MKKLLPVLAALLAACSQHSSQPHLSVDDVWARAVAPGQEMGAVYLTIRNDGDAPDVLKSIKVSVAPMTEIHETKTIGGVSSMSPTGPVEIPAHGKVELKPGGMHAMMMGLTVPLKADDRFFVDLTFEKAGNRSVSGKVVAAGAR